MRNIDLVNVLLFFNRLTSSFPRFSRPWPLLLGRFIDAWQLSFLAIIARLVAIASYLPGTTTITGLPDLVRWPPSFILMERHDDLIM